MICLQGGGEFSPACREMDALLLDGLAGTVVVTALAGTVGEDYRRATENGVQHFRALGADAVAAPDARERRDEALQAVAEAALVVLPGGSPKRLLTALTETGLDRCLADLLERGGRLMGASAGAMVLGPWTVLPEGGLSVVPGLGLSPVSVVPHWSGGRDEWVAAIGGRAPVVGLAEEAGVLVERGALTAVGSAPARLVDQERDLAVGQTWSLP